jgi:hypothetical protein
LVFLFCPETAYQRDESLNIDLGTIDLSDEMKRRSRHTRVDSDGLRAVDVGSIGSFADEVVSEYEKSQSLRHEKSTQTMDLERVQTNTTYGANEKAYTFIEELRLFRGVESDDTLWKVILRPFPMLAFPQVMYTFITYGLSTAWLIVLGGVSALIFGGPPYNMSVSEIGLLGIGGLVTSFIGFAAGPISDSLCKWMARRNGGVYEPEVPPLHKDTNSSSVSYQFSSHSFSEHSASSVLASHYIIKSTGWSPSFSNV